MQNVDRRGFAKLAGGLALACVGCGRASEAAPSARRDLYQCEGCEGAHERDAATLSASARIADLGEPGDRMRIEGVVRRADGGDPAADVVLYAYHTNAAGLYANGSNETTWSRRHGRLRGWVKTGADGRYAFDTIKPAPYPDRTLPAHVHFTVLEPRRRPYWIDDIVFEGETLVTPAYRAAMELRGGDGVTRLSRTAEGVWIARRDITLERHPA